MSFFIATGSNMGDRLSNLNEAKRILSLNFTFIAESRIYESTAVDYLNQPDFYNQVVEFATPSLSPESVMDFLLQTELSLGRNRIIPKGPRTIDLDILFWDNIVIKSEKLTLPHPRLFERSFVVLPLSELPGFVTLQKSFSFNLSYDNSCSPIS